MGAVATLSFLVLLQAYHLLGNDFVGIGPMAAAAVGVFVASSLTTHRLAPQLAPRNERP
ncbi:hypothetical protein [Halovenus salina]|uniref:DUF7981 domain-containing protein n=1 Tax=Halovenus salina TaxID=1510225 RepID=A0ABD5W1Z1_9EURY